MSNIYSDKFENLCIFVGDLPAGKALDIKATDDNLQNALDAAKQEWLDANPEPEEYFSEEHAEWEELRDRAHDLIGIKLVESAEWYDNAYVWSDAE